MEESSGYSEIEDGDGEDKEIVQNIDEEKGDEERENACQPGAKGETHRALPLSR